MYFGYWKIVEIVENTHTYSIFPSWYRDGPTVTGLGPLWLWLVWQTVAINIHESEVYWTWYTHRFEPWCSVGGVFCGSGWARSFPLVLVCIWPPQGRSVKLIFTRGRSLDIYSQSIRIRTIRRCTSARTTRTCTSRRLMMGLSVSLLRLGFAMLRLASPFTRTGGDLRIIAGSSTSLFARASLFTGFMLQLSFLTVPETALRISGILLGMIYSQIRRRHHGVYSASESLRLAPSNRTVFHWHFILTTEPGLQISAINNWTNAHIFELVLGWCVVAGGWWCVFKFVLVPRLGWGGVGLGGLWWVSSSTCSGLNETSSVIYLVTHRRTYTYIFELALGCCGVAWCWWRVSMFCQWCSICGGLTWKIISDHRSFKLNICSRVPSRRRLICTTRLRVFTVCFSLIPESLL